jgi:hypothetical protein
MIEGIRAGSARSAFRHNDVGDLEAKLRTFLASAPKTVPRRRVESVVKRSAASLAWLRRRTESVEMMRRSLEHDLYYIDHWSLSL